jgi:hypothetical protein
MAAMRSPRVFGHHAQALGAEDLEEIVADYSNDAIFITRQASNAARMASARRSPSSSARCRRPPTRWPVFSDEL